MNDEDTPDMRLILAALFVAARIIAGQGNSPTLVSASVADADELLRQAVP
jgi:hypothetical protein